MEWITLAALARELQVSDRDMYRKAQELGIRAGRMAAKVRQQDADRLRRAILSARQLRQKAVLQRQERPHSAELPADKAKYLKVTAKPVRDLQPPPGPPRCPCCEAFLGRVRDQLPDPPVCRPCAVHWQETGPDADVARQTEHAARFRRWHEQAQAQLVQAAGQVSSALRSRDGWRRTVVLLAVKHEPDDEGHCRWCGPDDAYPCRFVATLDRINRGHARQVERFWSMTDDELEGALGELDDDLD